MQMEGVQTFLYNASFTLKVQSSISLLFYMAIFVRLALKMYTIIFCVTFISRIGCKSQRSC